MPVLGRSAGEEGNGQGWWNWCGGCGGCGGCGCSEVIILPEDKYTIADNN